MKNLKVLAIALLATVGVAGCGNTPEGDKPAEVTVTLSDVSVDASGATTRFLKGSEFTAEGLKVVATYSDSTKKEFSGTDLTVTAPDMTSAGEKQVTVKVTVDGEDKIVTYKVNVVELTKVELDTTGAKTSFVGGEEFTSEGLKAVATYSDESTVEYSGADLVVTAPENMVSAGEKEVGVKVTIDGEEKNLTYTVMVDFWSDDDIAFFQEYTWIGEIAPFPYLRGMTLELEVDQTTQELTDWCLKLENATEDDLEAYAMAFEEIAGAFTFQGYQLALQPAAVDYADVVESAVEYAGLASVETTLVYSAIPTYNGNEIFYSEEYYVMGLDEESNLIVKQRQADVTFFLDNIDYYDLDDGFYYYNQHGTASGLRALFNTYFSSDSGIGEFALCAKGLFQLPEVESAEASMSIIDHRQYNPFDTQYDEDTFAIGIELLDATDAERTAWLSTLTGKGFVKDQEGETFTVVQDGDEVQVHYDVLELNDPFYGNWTVKVSDFVEDYGTDSSTGANIGGFGMTVIFDEPSVNVSKAVRTGIVLLTNEMELQNIQLNPKNSSNFVGFAPVQTGTTAEGVHTLLAGIAGMSAVGDPETSDAWVVQSYAFGDVMLDIAATVETGDQGFDVATLDVTAYTGTPVELTAASLAQIVGDLNNVTMEEDAGTPGLYLGYNDDYAQVPVEDPQALFEVLELIEVQMPEYVELYKQALSYGQMENGAYLTIQSYVTNDLRFQIDVAVYQLLGNTGSVLGFEVEFAVYEKEEIVVPDGLTAETLAKAIAAECGVAETSVKVQSGMYYFNMQATNGYSSTQVTPEMLVGALGADVLAFGGQFVPEYCSYLGSGTNQSSGLPFDVYQTIDGAFNVQVSLIVMSGTGIYALGLQFIVYAN